MGPCSAVISTQLLGGKTLVNEIIIVHEEFQNVCVWVRCVFVQRMFCKVMVRLYMVVAQSVTPFCNILYS